MKQLRFIPISACGLGIRENGDGGESRTIEGTPIVFGVRSVNLTPWSDTREVYEVLEPGCIDQDLLQRSDVVLNLNHSNLVPDVLGRFRNTEKDTLSLELNEKNVGCRCDLPNTANADAALELMRRGDITGMSFAFTDDNQDSENGVSYERTEERTEDGKEVWLRHVWLVTSIFDVANVTHPAYEQTSVATREALEAIDKAIEEQLQHECGGKDDVKRGCGKDDKRDDDPDDKDDIKDDDPDDADEQAKREQEERELEEQAQRAREARMLRLRGQRLRMESEF